MKIIVAVSGGIDSVVLLDMLRRSDHRLIVAHVDHGMRGDSAADARFVEALAREYRLPFVSTELHLGAAASEERARLARYDFLLGVAKEHGGVIATAHHQDDIVETIAINLSRGTGWRGLAVLERAGIMRPLLGLTKQQITRYALRHRLEWVEDSTNHSEKYLRNRFRKKIAAGMIDASQLAILRARQLQLKHDIGYEVDWLLVRHRGSRHFLTQVDPTVAVELLARHIQSEAHVRPVNAQLTRALIAVKVAQPGTVHHVGDRVALHFSARKYRVSVL